MTNKAQTNRIENAPTIIFDGACGFCRRQIERIRRLDRKGVFDYCPSNAADLLIRFPQLAQQNLDSGMRLVTPEGVVHVGADAVYQISRQLAYVRWLSWLYRIPILNTFWRTVYAWVAARRYQLARKCDSNCKVNE